MFGKRRFYSSRSDPGNLIYADTLSGEAAPKAVPDRKRRLAAFLLAVGAVAVLAMTAVAVRYVYQERQDRYDHALALVAEKEYEDAAEELEKLGNFRDSQTILEQLARQQAAYETAVDLVDQQRYSEAITAFRALEDYADSAEWAAYHVTYQMALDLIWQLDLGQTQLLTRLLPENTRLTDENSYPTTVGYEAAAALLESLGDYRSAPALMDRCYYSAGLVKLGWEDWEGALAYMEKMTPGTAAGFYEEYLQRYEEYTAQEGQ